MGTESQVVTGFASECVLRLGEVGERGGWVGVGGALGGAWGPGFQWRVISLGTQEKLDCGWLSLGNSTFLSP